MWAILALALVVPRANRTRQALLILVPALLVNVAWLGAALLFQLITSDDETFAMVVRALTVGSGVLWLLGHMLANYTRWKAIVLALGLTLGVALVGAFSVTDFSRRTISLPLLLSSLTPALVLGYVGAGWMSRRRYRPTKFLLLLAAWTVAFSAVGMPLWFLLQSAVTADWPADILLVFGVFLLAGAILGVCVFLISLSFVLVGLRSPLFRPRLFACLVLPPGLPARDNVTVADLHEEG